MAGKRSASKHLPRGRQHLAFAGVGTVTQVRCAADGERLVVDVAGSERPVRVLRCPVCDWQQVVPAAVEVALAGGDLLPGIEEDQMAPNTDGATYDAVAVVEKSWGGRSARNVLPRPGESAGELTLAVAALNPSPLNPRKRFDQQALADLAESLRENGMLQPVVVRPIPEGQPGHGAYWIVAGERRWRAAQLAGLKHIPVRILEHLDDAGHLRLALTENDARKDLDPVEQARAYRQLAELTGQTQAQIGQSIGRAPSTIANALRLLDLPEDVLTRISVGELSPSHGKALVRFAQFDRLASKLGELAAANDWPSKTLEGGLPRQAINALHSAKLGELLNYAAGFDTNVCKQACPFGAYVAPAEQWEPGLCLRPAHMKELQREHQVKRETEEQARRDASAAVLDAASGPIQLAQLQHGTYRPLRFDRPPGCSSECPCERRAVDHRGEELPICIDLGRQARLQRAAKMAETANRTRQRRAAEARLGTELLAGEGLSRRALALAAAVVLRDVREGAAIRESAERYAPALLPLCRGGEASRSDWEQEERLFALAGIEPAALVRFVVDAYGRQEIDSIYREHSWSGAGLLVRWFADLRTEAPAEAVMGELPEDDDDVYPRESDVYCEGCNEPITVASPEEDRDLATRFAASESGALVTILCVDCQAAEESERRTLVAGGLTDA